MAFGILLVYIQIKPDPLALLYILFIDLVLSNTGTMFPPTEKPPHSNRPQLSPRPPAPPPTQPRPPSTPTPVRPPHALDPLEKGDKPSDTLYSESKRPPTSRSRIMSFEEPQDPNPYPPYPGPPPDRPPPPIPGPPPK